MLTTASPAMNYNDLSQLTGCPMKGLHAVGNSSLYVASGSESLSKRLKQGLYFPVFTSIATLISRNYLGTS